MGDVVTAGIRSDGRAFVIKRMHLCLLCLCKALCVEVRAAAWNVRRNKGTCISCAHGAARSRAAWQSVWRDLYQAWQTVWCDLYPISCGECGWKTCEQTDGGSEGCTLLVCVCMEVPRAARSPTSPRCTCMRACKAPPCTGAFLSLVVPPGVVALLKSSESDARLAPCCAAALQSLKQSCSASCPFASSRSDRRRFRMQRSPTAT